jgi:hypothetical protein
MEIENGELTMEDRDDYITDSQIDSNGLLYVLGISSSSNNISTINTNTLVILMQIVS